MLLPNEPLESNGWKKIELFRNTTSEWSRSRPKSLTSSRTESAAGAPKSGRTKQRIHRPDGQRRRENDAYKTVRASYKAPLGQVFALECQAKRSATSGGGHRADFSRRR